MAWALVVAVAVVGAWLWLQRRPRLPRIVAAPELLVEDGGARPMPRSSGGNDSDSRWLIEAFRPEEAPVSADAERDDRVALVRILKLLAEYTEAHEAVLWEPHEGPGGRLIAAAWSRGAEPPALGEQERALVELAAEEGHPTFNPTGPHLRLMACGVDVRSGKGAVSVHFPEAPTLSREEIQQRLMRMAEEVSLRHDLVHARAALASRTKSLRGLIRTAITLQGKREPNEQQEIVVHDGLIIATADWGVLLRRVDGGGLLIVRTSGQVPEALQQKLTAQRNTIAGEVQTSGQKRLITDTRLLQDERAPLFDGTPIPHGTRSLIIVPIKRSDLDDSLGVLVFGRTGPVPFNSVDIGCAMDLATIAAGALDTAWAFKDATHSARTDQLTGLPNRRAFEEEFSEMIAETDRYGKPSALVIVDVDFFKKVNDTYGHDAGDKVLKQVGMTLVAQKRTTDKVARLGGEELAILLPQTERDGALEAAERCRRAIEAMAVEHGGTRISVTASFGVAMYEPRSQGAGSLFDRADQALYAAKHGGRNRVVLADH